MSKTREVIAEITTRAKERLDQLASLGDFDAHAAPVREAFELISVLAARLAWQEAVLAQILPRIEAALDRTNRCLDIIDPGGTQERSAQDAEAPEPDDGK